MMFFNPSNSPSKILFIMFSATLIMFNTMNYYSAMTNPPKTQQSNNPQIKTMNWKW